MACTDRVQQFLMVGILEQIGMGAGFERPQNLYIAGVGRQYNHLCIGKLISNHNERVNTVHFRHLQIHQRDIGTVSAELLNGLATIGGLSYYSDIRLNSKQTGDPLPYDRMVVDRENPNLRTAGGHKSMLSSLRQIFATTRNVCDLSRRRRWQERGVPLRFPHRLRSTPPAYLG